MENNISWSVEKLDGASITMACPEPPKENIMAITMRTKEVSLTNRDLAIKILSYLVGNTDELKLSSPHDESCFHDTISTISELAKDINEILGAILVSLGA